MPIVKSHQLDLNQISLTDVKTNDNGGKSIYVNYQKSLFKMQTPVMTMPYALSCFDKGDTPKYSIDVAFRDMDTDHRVRGFHENMKSLEQHILNQGLENSKAWFQKKIKSLDVLNALFTPIVKQSIDKATGEPDGRYADTIKLKFPFWNGKFKVEVCDFDDNVIENPDMDAIFTKETKIQAIVRCGGVWVVGGKFGCTWSVEKIRVESKESSGGGNGMSFINDESDSGSDSDGGEVEDSSDEE